MDLIFEKSVPGRGGVRISSERISDRPGLPPEMLRAEPAALPEVSESEVVRHYTRLSQLNYSVDTQFYPLGSCTMKHNPRACEAAAALPGLCETHPLWPQLRHGGLLTQGSLQILYALERALSEVTGMAEFTLQPMAGAHGELTAVMMIAAYHRSRGNHKTQLIIPDSAHGTNPASAAIGGYEVVTIPSDASGDMDLTLFKEVLNEETAGVMLTLPGTLGVFNPRIREIIDAVHEVDGLVYYDGANFNAIMGRMKPGELGFDLCHLNLHKTFSTPHGGGGPGAGPVGVCERLRRFLPISRIAKTKDGTFTLDYDHPDSIGYIAPFYGNFGVLVRAYAYLLMLGRDGVRAVSDRAVLNANYVQERLRPVFKAVTKGRCMHECVFRGEFANEIRTVDLAKALLDRGFHAPTIYFPLNVPEAIMIEPTETETRETLDAFCEAMIELAEQAESDPDGLRQAPVSTPVGRLDEVAAAKNMELVAS